MVVAGSMDVSALYPSIQWVRGSDEMFKGIKESKVVFKDLNVKELVQYIALNYSRQEISNAGVEHLIPLKLPGTNAKLAAREGDQSHLFDYNGVQEPGGGDINTLVGLAIKKASHLCLSSHFYTFEGEIRRQSKGGSIGSELTGEISKLYMLR